MSLLPFLALASTAGLASLALRSRPRASAAIGVVGLLVGLVAAAAIRVDAPVALDPPGAATATLLAGTSFARLFLVLGCVTGLLLILVAAGTSWSPVLPGATLLALGGSALALGSSAAAPAVAAATVAGVTAVLVALPSMATDRGLVAGAHALRSLVVAGAVALVAVAGVAGPIVASETDPAIVGLAYVAVVGAVAIRFGAIPFHLSPVRLAGAAPLSALPLVMAWAPATFALVALGWADDAVAPLGLALDAERGLVILIAIATIVLGAAAAVLHDELEQVVAYSILTDGGFVLLGLAAVDPAAWQPTRVWLLALVVTRTAFAGWALAARSIFGAHRVSELGGWARRAPLLALALVAIGIAAVGAPGTAVFVARRSLIELALSGPVAVVAIVAPLASLTWVLRLLVAGLRQPAPELASASDLRPRWPAGKQRMIRRDPRAEIGAALDANRGPIAAAGVLALAALAVAVAGGGLGVRDAAAGLPPAADVLAGDR